MSTQAAYQDETIDFTPVDIAILFGVCASIILLLYIFRFVINICVIDICILGDCSSCSKIFRCCRRDVDENDNTPQPWGARDALALQTIGAFADPIAYLYSDELDEEKRKILLDIIIKNELVMSNSKETDPSSAQMKRDNAKENFNADVDIKSESVHHHKHGDGDCEANSEQEMCSICLMELDDGRFALRNCDHAFHHECLKSWISRSLTCPICRENIIELNKLRDYMASNMKVLMDK